CPPGSAYRRRRRTRPASPRGGTGSRPPDDAPTSSTGPTSSATSTAYRRPTATPPTGPASRDCSPIPVRHTATRSAPSEPAEAALHRFQAGLRATHTGPRSHNTVVGLSYGTTVVGLTGHAYGLDADDIVLLGSPGTGVAHAADLGLDPGHVWASTAAHDV